MKKFDFDEWSKLAATDPQAFERRRRHAVEQLIKDVPKERQPRMRGIQWHVDMIRRKYRDPRVCAQRVFNMMWDSVYGRKGLLDALRLDPEVSLQPSTAKPATVLSFASPRRTGQA